MTRSSWFQYDPAHPAADDPGAQLFMRTLDADEWTRFLSVAQRLAFAPGEIVLHEGESSRSFYVVAFGELEAFCRDDDGAERFIQRIEPMSIFGEQAFFDGLPRSATVRGVTAGELFGISPDAFDVIAAKYPDLARLALFDLGRLLSLRLRDSTSRLGRRA